MTKRSACFRWSQWVVGSRGLWRWQTVIDLKNVGVQWIHVSIEKDVRSRQGKKRELVWCGRSLCVLHRASSYCTQVALPPLKFLLCIICGVRTIIVGGLVPGNIAKVCSSSTCSLPLTFTSMSAQFAGVLVSPQVFSCSEWLSTISYILLTIRAPSQLFLQIALHLHCSMHSKN